MSDPANIPPTAPRFEVRPSPLKTWNPDAPDEYVNLDAKPLGFGDMLEALNPLQHLPVIGSIYRSVTGATIEPAARVVGGMLFGGLGGGLSSVANAIIEGISGKDIGESLIAMVSPGKDAPPPPPSADSLAAPGGNPEFQLASFAPGAPAGGTTERNGLLTTWTAGGQFPPAPAPEFDMRMAQAPVRSPGAIVAKAVVPPPAPMPEPVRESAVPQLAAAAPIAGPAPAARMAEPEIPRAMSLDSYRARAQSVLPQGPMARAPVASDAQGLAQRGEAMRALAANRSQAPLPAALQAQQAIDAAGEPQTFFSASMALGLERYRQMQQQRDDAARRGI
ncbi:MAG: hypothetical protein JNL71_05240 [Rhodospirillales bacterium]|nr:hypothetical protein [Rhodospirillales bacterium]